MLNKRGRIMIGEMNFSKKGNNKMASLPDLTARELQILQLVIEGKTNKLIAHEIYISEKTVEFHLDHIYTKIGVRTRLLAVVWAIRQGLGRKTREIPS